MFGRYASAITSGTIITFALLFVMQLLISLQPGAQIDARTRHTLNPFELKNEDTPVQPREYITPREKLTRIESPPARPRPGSKHGSVRVSYPAPAPPGAGGGIIGPGAFNDGPLVVLVRVAPVYPARAITRGIEGYVVVQFDVMADGRVANIVIIESTNSVFDSAAIKAAERFRFKPRVIDGMALDSYGIQNMFRFTLDDE